MKIDEFIARKLFLLNAEHPGIKVEDATAKFRRKMADFQRSLDKVNILIDDEPLDAFEIAKVKAEIPNFKKPLVWQTADGSLMLEVIL
jgi:hypothetical protein